jgi:hypothetical protein
LTIKPTTCDFISNDEAEDITLYLLLAASSHTSFSEDHADPAQRRLLTE